MKKQKKLKDLSIKKEIICILGQRIIRGGNIEIGGDIPTNTTSNNCQGVSVQGCCRD